MCKSTKAVILFYRIDQLTDLTVEILISSMLKNCWTYFPSLMYNTYTTFLEAMTHMNTFHSPVLIYDPWDTLHLVLVGNTEPVSYNFPFKLLT